MSAGRQGWNLECTYEALPSSFYTAVRPTPVRSPRLVVFNRGLARDLGLDPEAMDSEAGAAILAGNELPPGATPIAQAYAGHQFGQFTQLGDGRAVLLGEQIAPDGKRYDIQLKGSGQTPYSRRGDGRAALGPMLREYIISEAMHGLGIPTTRTLAVVATGEPVYREAPLPGAVMARTATSHIRVGTFEFAARRSGEDLRALTGYAIRRHAPECLEEKAPVLCFLRNVIDKQAMLLAKWQLTGFVHGVMNTDNMAVSGETIDYGPCAFIDVYDPDTVFSSIDRGGRYAFGNQPPIAQWDLARFAETLLPLIDPQPTLALELAREAVGRFASVYETAWLSGMRNKLGLDGEEPDDASLAAELWKLMHRHKLDLTNTFRELSQLPQREAEAERRPPVLPTDTGMQDWIERWSARRRRSGTSAEAEQRMRSSNPWIIPRNHRVEAALASAVEEGDLAPLHRLVGFLEDPYGEPDPAASDLMEPPPPGTRHITYCGT